MDPNPSTKQELAQLAARLGQNLSELRRPLIIEFAGTPKSGKTTCVDAIAKFLRRNGIPVHRVTERASVSPISDKHHLFFNTWTGAMSLAQLLAILEQQNGVAILDRGLFDTLVWMNFLAAREAVSTQELSVIEDFFLLERWASRVDIVVVMSVSPDRALEREFQDQITDKLGSIMNPEILKNYNASLHFCLQKYRPQFRRMIHIDTTDKKSVEGVTAIAFEVLAVADELVDEEIGIVPRQLVEQYMPDSGVMKDPDEVANFTKVLIDQIKWIRRTIAEADITSVQLVSTASLRRNDEILILTIRDKRGGRLTDRMAVWVGGHVRKADLRSGSAKSNLFRWCLARELDEELRIRADFGRLDTLPRAVIWDKTTPKSIQHLGLIFEYSLTNRMPKNVLHQREIWETPDKSLFTQFHHLDSSLKEFEDWESWSILYLRQVHGIDFPLQDRQMSLF